jgi:hypothetical protein
MGQALANTGAARVSTTAPAEKNTFENSPQLSGCRLLWTACGTSEARYDHYCRSQGEVFLYACTGLSHSRFLLLVAQVYVDLLLVRNVS